MIEHGKIDQRVHESARLHVSGRAGFIDDIPLPPGTLHVVPCLSPVARGRLMGIDTSEAQLVEGVVAILTHQDIPGVNQVGPVVHDEVLLCVEQVEYLGQVFALVAATTVDAARKASLLVRARIEEEEAILTLDEAIRTGQVLEDPRHIRSGDLEKGWEASELLVEGRLETGAQEHWYLESQAALAIPGEGMEMHVWSSTQHPSETQAIVAEVLDRRRADIIVDLRRLGGAFGGKETQANHIAAWAALVAAHSGRPARCRLFRDHDQLITGKRHPYRIEYKAGFSAQGMLMAYEVTLLANAGHATDLSMAILERAMFHALNAYHCPNVSVTGKAWKTHTASNTAFRGFGAPQAMAAIEKVMQEAARRLGIPAWELRRKNMFGEGRMDTPYGQPVEDFHLSQMWERLADKEDLFKRQQAVDDFNRSHEDLKRGLAMSPVMFGISFTTTFLNQAAARLSLFRDGTVLLSHGGIEMGQGLHTKMRRIASLELGILDHDIRVQETSTDAIPNTSATAASSGSDMNGMAIRDAAGQLRGRMAPVAKRLIRERFGRKAEGLIWADGRVADSADVAISIPISELAEACYKERISLSANGFYATPGLYFDKLKGKGHPFHYYAYGVALSEVELDTLSGAVRVTDVSILHDCGASIDPGIDMGQVTGGFVQGLGWVLLEECGWDARGALMHHSPDTYKIPTVGDMPERFEVEFGDQVQGNTIHGSKAVGEPPFMLAFSAWLAVLDAMEAARAGSSTEMGIPATAERILLALSR